ncbi:MAG: ABC transporter ATP-binding protein [bacterium]|nr:ABC transporter ATP-binding protein [bacterium]
MNNDIIMSVDKVSKKFCRSLKKSMVYGVTDIAKNMLGLSSHSERLRSGEFWAMDDVSFELKQGESLALIGPNGSGKTTMLKMLNGIFWPDKGKISMRGRMGALISVGAGFHPLLTGRENIYINGAILGMNKSEVDRKFDSIIAFADIGDFLDSPVKHYSSGMFVRLGFAVAVHCEPDILLVDEILAVGDMNFQAKCIDRMEELGRQGTTKIYVSHDLNSVARICKKALYLSGGKTRGYGEVADIIEQYKKDVVEDMRVNSNKTHEVRYGTREIEILKVEFRDKNNESKQIFKRGEPFKVNIAYHAHKDVRAPEFVIKFFTDNGTLVSQPNTKDHKVTRETVTGKGELEYSIDSLPLALGHYSVTVAIWDFAGHLPHDVHEKLYDFIVEPSSGNINERRGLVYMPAEWKWK